MRSHVKAGCSCVDSEYVTALYIRFSVDDGLGGDSSSIVGQRSLINDFLDSHSELNDCRRTEFCDDGYSGTNFKRPGIEKLLGEVKSGCVQCIIVKDFSRFGRNYIEVGEYLEYVFPFLNVRFISVNDGYDSQTQNAGDIDVAFKQIYNDYYSRDLSAKVKSSIRTKWESGKFMSSYAVYGYRKNPENKHQLITDENTAPVVRRIFELALAGCKLSRIAAALNEANIPTPMTYVSQTHAVNTWSSLPKIWTDRKIINIIRDIRYTGVLTHGMYTVKECGSRTKYKTDKSTWVTHENTHEAIVSKDEYESAQACIRKSEKNTNRKKILPYSLPVQIRCGGCGHSMLVRNTKKYNTYYYCRYKFSLDNITCFSGKITIDSLKHILLVSVQNLHDIVAEHTKTLEAEITPTADTLRQLHSLQKETERITNEKLAIYSRYKDNEISKDDYFARRTSADERLRELTAQKVCLEQNITLSENETVAANPVCEAMKDMPYPVQFSDEVIANLIDYVTVHDESRVEIKWNFSNYAIAELSKE